jgi:alpha-galactosidase
LRVAPPARYRAAGTGDPHHGAITLTHGLIPELSPGDHAGTLIHLLRAGRPPRESR